MHVQQSDAALETVFECKFVTLPNLLNTAIKSFPFFLFSLEKFSFIFWFQYEEKNSSKNILKIEEIFFDSHSPEHVNTFLNEVVSLIINDGKNQSLADGHYNRYEFDKARITRRWSTVE